MKSLFARLVVVLAVPFLVLSLTQAGPSTLLLAGAALLAASMLLVVRCAAPVGAAREITIGSRSHRDREVLNSMAAPRHPNTPGRPRTRAPARSEALA